MIGCDVVAIDTYAKDMFENEILAVQRHQPLNVTLIAQKPPPGGHIRKLNGEIEV